MAKKKRTVQEMVSDIGMIDARVNKVTDTIKQIDSVLTIITIKSQDKDIQDIVDTTTKDMTALKTKLTKKMQGYQATKEELVGKEV